MHIETPTERERGAQQNDSLVDGQVIPRMLTMAADLPSVNLALSLHAPTQELRSQIMPAAKVGQRHIQGKAGFSCSKTVPFFSPSRWTSSSMDWPSITH